MASRLAAKEKDEAAVDMTPMLDIVFIMLIFFIVTATFVKQSGLEVIRPDAETAEDQRKKNIKPTENFVLEFENYLKKLKEISL